MDVFVILILSFIVLYFLPTMIALSKPRHKYVSAIVTLNILLGWTIIGWVVALVWSMMKEKEESE